MNRALTEDPRPIDDFEVWLEQATTDEVFAFVLAVAIPERGAR